MRRVVLAGTVLGTIALATACHTITEDLPNRPSPVDVSGGQAPVVVIVPVPTTQAPSSTTPPGPNPTPRPSDPGPNPTPQPSSNPDPGGVNDNTSPVAKVGAGVYFVECNGEVVPGSRGATTADVGCRVHLDCTPKDASNVPTNPRGTPEWRYSDPGLIQVTNNNAYNPAIVGRRAGFVEITASVDGVTSAPFGIEFK